MYSLRGIRTYDELQIVVNEVRQAKQMATVARQKMVYSDVIDLIKRFTYRILLEAMFSIT